MGMIEKDIQDHLLRRRLQDQIDRAYELQDVAMMREIAELLAESYVQSRVAAKWLGREAARNLGSMSQLSEEQ